MDSTITLFDQGAGELVEDVAPSKSSDCSSRPAGKRSSDKVTDCSFTSERTVDSSFISAVSRLKSTDDTFTTTDFESAGEEDLEISSFGNSDPWFESLEYDNGNLAVLSPNSSLHHDRDTDLTLQSPSVHSTLTNSDDCSILEEEVVGSTPVKTPRSKSTPEKSWKIKRNLSENRLSNNDCDIFPCDNSPSSYLETTDGRSKEREEVLSPIPPLVPNLHITARRSLTPKRDPVNYSRSDKENVSPIISKRHSLSDIKFNQIDDKNISRSPGDKNQLLRINDDIEKSVLNNRDKNKSVEKLVNPETPSSICQNESKPVNDLVESQNQGIISERINIIINNDGITTVENIKTDETLSSGVTVVHLTSIESQPEVTDESVFTSLLCDNTITNSDLDKTWIKAESDPKTLLYSTTPLELIKTEVLKPSILESTNSSEFIITEEFSQTILDESKPLKVIKTEEGSLSLLEEFKPLEFTNTEECTQSRLGESTPLELIKTEESPTTILDSTNPLELFKKEDNSLSLLKESKPLELIKTEEFSESILEEPKLLEFTYTEEVSHTILEEFKPLEFTNTEECTQSRLGESTPLELIKTEESPTTILDSTNPLELFKKEDNSLSLLKESKPLELIKTEEFSESILEEPKLLEFTYTEEVSHTILEEFKPLEFTNTEECTQSRLGESTPLELIKTEESPTTILDSTNPLELFKKEDNSLSLLKESKPLELIKTEEFSESILEEPKLLEFTYTEEVSQTILEEFKPLEFTYTEEVSQTILEEFKPLEFTNTEEGIQSRLEEPKPLELIKTQESSTTILNSTNPLELFKKEENLPSVLKESEPLELIKTEEVSDSILEEPKLLELTYTEEISQSILEEIKPLEFINTKEGIKTILDSTNPLELIKTEVAAESILKRSNPSNLIKIEEGIKTILDSTNPLELIKTEVVSESLLEELKPLELIKTEVGSEIILDSTNPLELKESILLELSSTEKSPDRPDNLESSIEEAEVTVKEVISLETKVPLENKTEMSDHDISVLCDDPLLNSTLGNKSVGMDSLIGAMEGMKMNSTFCLNKTLASDDLNHGEYEVPDCVSDISSDPDHLNNMTEEELENLLEPDFAAEMKPLDLNTTEAGPVTAGDDIQAGELSQVISDADVDISALKRKADQNADNSLIRNFDPLTDLPTSNHLNDSLFGNIKESGDVEVEVTPIKDHHVGLLIPITPVQESSLKRNKGQPTSAKCNTPSAGSTPSTSRTLTFPSQQDEGLSPVQVAITKELTKLQEGFKERMRIHEDRKKEVLQKIAEAQKRKDRNIATLKKLGEKRPHIQKLEKAKIVNAELKESCDEAHRKSGEFLGVLGNYEKALRDVLNRNETEKSILEAEVKVLLSERNTAQQHVVNMETALNDIHTKYDRSMKSVEELISGQSKKVELLRGRCKDLEIAKQKYFKLLGHASNRLEDTNREKMIMMRSHEGEAQRTRALIDQKELKIRNNDLTIKQKEKELREMRKIYEDLLSKLS